MYRILYCVILFCIMLGNVCFADIGDGGLIPEVEANRKIQEYTLDLEKLINEMQDIAVIVDKAAKISDTYTLQAEQFEKTVTTYIKELSSCKEMEVKYDLQNMEVAPRPSKIKGQKKALDRCAKRVEKSTIEHTDAEDFLSSLLDRVNNLKDEADISIVEMEALEKSRKTIETRIGWKRYVLHGEQPSNDINLEQNLSSN